MRSFVTATLVIGWKICYTEPENHPGDKRDAMLGYLQTIGEQFDWGGLLFALQRVLGVLVCLTIHETCHGLAAYALGDPTAKQMHRLSFNPLHHIDWMGLASMFICGFGWAKPVPVDMRYFKNPKAGMAATALAGPISNFLLAFVMLFLASLIYQAEQVGAVMVWVFYFLQTTAMLSIGLGLFNLLPIPPLDGSKVLFSLLPERAYYTLMRYERFGMLALLLLVWLDVGGGLLSQGIEAVFLWMAGLFFGH
jgi:Zn-dependent protease